MKREDSKDTIESNQEGEKAYPSHALAMAAARSFSCRLGLFRDIIQEKNVDAILLIAGVDGRDNLPARQALGYLLLDRSGAEALDGGFLPKELEDIFILVQQDSIRVFLTPAAMDFVRPLLIGVEASVDTYVATEEEADDPELLEERKVASFVHAVADLRRVGIPLTPQDLTRDKPLKRGMMEVETWPLVQAYGMEGVGKNGFFTMNVDIEDVTEDVTRAICTLDSTAALSLQEGTNAKLGRFWSEGMHALSAIDPEKRWQTATSETLLTPLANFWDFGTLRTPHGAVTPTTGPRVYVGSASGAASAPDLWHKPNATTAGLVGDPQPCHMVVEAADPQTGVYAARTYLLSHGADVGDLLEEIGAEDEDRFLMHDDVETLQEARKALDGAHERARSVVEIVLAATAVLREILRSMVSRIDWSDPVLPDVKELEKEAWGKMCDLLTRQHDSDKHPQAALSRDVVLLQIWSPNPRHSGPGLPATPYGPVCARLAVGGVPDGSGADTGSVVVGETILPLPGAGRALLLTSEVPGLASWSINGFEGRQEHKLASQLRARALEGGRREAAGKGAIARPAGDAREALVRPVLHPVKCPLLTGVAAASRVPGTLLCFSDGLAFLAEWLGHPLALPLSQRHVSSVEVDVSDAAGVGAVRMILTDAVQWAPVTLCADFSRCIRLDVTAMPASDGRAFRSRVLPDWQLQCKVQEILWHVRHVGPTDEHEASQGAEGPTADLLRPAGALEHADLDSIDAYASAMRAPGAAALWRHREAGMGESSAPGPMEALGEETEVHVWLAQPGIKLPELAQRLVELTGRRKGWAVAAKPETGWPSSQGAESALLPLLHSSADAMLRGAVATARAAAGPGERAAVVLCLWGMGCAGLAVQQLSSLPAFTAHRCRLCTVTAVVSAASVGSLSPHPLLCGAAGPSSLLIPGLVDNVVFVASAYDDIALAGRVASERCGSCRVYRTNALSGAGPEIWEPLQRRWEERLDLCLSATGWGSRPPSYPHGPAHAVACAASGTIDRDRLVEELEKHMDASEAAWAEVLPLEEAPGGKRPEWLHGIRIWTTDEQGTVTEVVGVAGQGVSIATTQLLPVADPKAGGAWNQELREILNQGDAVVLAWGAGVDASTVERILASAAPPPPAELRLTGRESMSPADMASAKERAQKAGLPDGWVFDGTFFRDSWGKASVDHPCLDKAVEEWLAERNRTLVEQHERAQRLWADVLPIRARLLRS